MLFAARTPDSKASLLAGYLEKYRNSDNVFVVQVVEVNYDAPLLEEDYSIFIMFKISYIFFLLMHVRSLFLRELIQWKVSVALGMSPPDLKAYELR